MTVSIAAFKLVRHTVCSTAMLAAAAKCPMADALVLVSLQVGAALASKTECIGGVGGPWAAVVAD